MTAALKLATPKGYTALNPDTVKDYLAALPEIAKKLGGKLAEWQSREVGDGNLNLVFIIKGKDGSVCVKQALPYVRLVGESWPLPLSRAHFEHLALEAEATFAPAYVPASYHYDEAMALTVMEYLSPHIILRKGLIRGIKYPNVAKHLGEFLALTLFHTSDLHLSAEEKKKQIAVFAANTAMCKISEDLIFDEPYFEAPMNRHTPGLEDIAKSFRADAVLKTAAQEMKWRFMNATEALIHGDLHTGSVMVTETDTRAIDPEFAFYGPMGFDVGAVIANLLLAYFAQSGHAEKHGARNAYASWILEQIVVLWEIFAATFTKLWKERDAAHPGGDVYAPRLYGGESGNAINPAIRARLEAIWNDTLGFAALKMIRRILGLAHVEDMEAIPDVSLRVACERKALTFARKLLVEHKAYGTPQVLAQKAMAS
ncbi:MAG: S-methyl-5-thioribose kinase [Alphaproteobacteria bacterium]|nr:S-methyl-5-thioribose kinase [Alphaproteobacteria bacterium]